MRMALIPARGGSKRIPRKNIRHFCGKPIIGYSIEAALQSGIFDRVVVSTDDDEIAKVAREYGGETPFVRPAELANDYAGTLPVVRHAIESMRELGVDCEFVCCIYATAPFVTAMDIQRGMAILHESDADYAISVTSYAYPVARALRVLSSGRVAMFSPENYYKRSQELEEVYHDAGQFYWGKAEAFLGEVPLLSEASMPIFLPRHQVQDIDTAEDWIRAELMYKAWCQRGADSMLVQNCQQQSLPTRDFNL